MDEERMRPGHWFGLLLCVSSSALTYWLANRKDIWPIKSCAINPQRFSSRTSGGGSPGFTP